MVHTFLLATAETATWFGREHRMYGLDWSYLTILGLLGNAVFSTRFLVQWIASARKGESVVPTSFWHWSILGSVILCLYWIMQREPVGILSYLPNTFIYIRNLHLIKRKRAAVSAAITPNPGSATK